VGKSDKEVGNVKRRARGGGGRGSNYDTAVDVQVTVHSVDGSPQLGFRMVTSH